MKKILITGASGFVGYHLVLAAFQAGYEVHVAVRKSSNISDISPFVTQFFYPDFNQFSSLLTLFSTNKYDYVIHAAAMTKAKSEDVMKEANVKLTEGLVEAAFYKESQAPLRFVFVSSLAAIGPVAYDEVAIKEGNPYQPVTMYGRSKQKAEQLIKEKFSDKPISIIRPTAVYGPREKDLFILFDTMNKGLDAYVGRTAQKLSFVYIKDLVELLLQACVVPQQGLEIYNVSDGRVYSRYAMAEIFKKTFHRKLFRIHVPYGIVRLVAYILQWWYRNSSKTAVIYPERLGELTAENWECDITCAQQKLGFRPKFDLQKGLTSCLHWYKKNNWF